MINWFKGLFEKNKTKDKYSGLPDDVYIKYNKNSGAYHKLKAEVTENQLSAIFQNKKLFPYMSLELVNIEDAYEQELKTLINFNYIKESNDINITTQINMQKLDEIKIDNEPLPVFVRNRCLALKKFGYPDTMSYYPLSEKGLKEIRNLFDKEIGDEK